MSDDEETLFEVEVAQSPEDVAGTLRSIADDLESGADIAVDLGGESITLSAPGDDLEFEVEVEREGTELELELELEWDDEQTADDESVPQDDLSIE